MKNNHHLNKYREKLKMEILAIVTAAVLWTALRIWTGYLLRKLDEEVEHAEIRARIWAALKKGDAKDE